MSSFVVGSLEYGVMSSFVVDGLEHGVMRQTHLAFYFNEFRKPLIILAISVTRDLDSLFSASLIYFRLKATVVQTRHSFADLRDILK